VTVSQNNTIPLKWRH